VARCIAAVCRLQRANQAVCVRLAAESNLPLWRAWCHHRGIEDLSGPLLDCFDRWLDGAATRKELNDIAKQFHRALSADIAAEDEPAAGYAGWALRDIPVVALGQGKDMHEDIVHTAICYAAAASCGIGPEAVNVDLGRLTRPELRFLRAWWDQCRDRVPALTEAG
jgi:hypothetical protein